MDDVEEVLGCVQLEQRDLCGTREYDGTKRTPGEMEETKDLLGT